MASISRALLTSTRRLALTSRLPIASTTTRAASSWKCWTAPIECAGQVRAPRLNSLIPRGSDLSITRWYGAAYDFTEEQVSKIVLDVLKMFDKVDPSKVTLDAHFTNDLGLDSLDIVEVVMAFEDEFGVEISDEEAEKIFSCKDAVKVLMVKVEE